MKTYYAYKDSNSLSTSWFMYVCGKSKRVAQEIVQHVAKTPDYTIRAINKTEDDYDIFNDYFMQRQGYADTTELLNTAGDIYKLKFIPYKTRKEKIDLLLTE